MAPATPTALAPSVSEAPNPAVLAPVAVEEAMPPVESSPPPPAPALRKKEDDDAIPAKFGQSLKPGLYVFPDGLRLRVTQIANCDFDTSEPCFGGTYRAHATLGAKEAKVEWHTKTTKVLAYTLTLARFEFTVRK